MQRHERAIAARRQRLGWRVQVTNAPADCLSLPQSVRHYREGWSLEREFHLVKDLPLGLSPLFVWKDDQIKGLISLLNLALRLVTLLETQVRQGLEHVHETIAGLYEGQLTRTTQQSTGKRILHAFTRAHMTLTHPTVGAMSGWHLKPLSPLHEQLLWYLRLPPSLYTALAYNSS